MSAPQGSCTWAVRVFLMLQPHPPFSSSGSPSLAALAVVLGTGGMGEQAGPVKETPDLTAGGVGGRPSTIKRLGGLAVGILPSAINSQCECEERAWEERGSGRPLGLQLAVAWVWCGRGVECHMGCKACRQAWCEVWTGRIATTLEGRGCQSRPHRVARRAGKAAEQDLESEGSGQLLR